MKPGIIESRHFSELPGATTRGARPRQSPGEMTTMPNDPNAQAATGTQTSTTTTEGTQTQTQGGQSQQTTQEGGQQTQQTQQTQGTTDDLSKLTPEQLRDLVEKERAERQKANKEAQELRKRATTAETDLKKRQEAEMTELEKAQARAKELETQLAQSSRQSQDARIMVAAAKLGFNDPSDAVALINRSDLAEDEKNLDTLLKEVLKSKPYLGKGKTTTPNTSANNPGDGTQNLDDKAKRDKAVSMFPTIGRLVGRK